MSTGVKQFAQLSAVTSDEALGEAVDAVDKAIDEGLDALGLYLVQQSLDAYNATDRNEPYRVWVVRTAFGTTVYPWGHGKIIKKRIAVLFFRNQVGLQIVDSWNAPELAKRMTKAFRTLDDDPELCDMMAYTLKDSSLENIFIKPIGTETDIERSHKVGGYFD